MDGPIALNSLLTESEECMKWGNKWQLHNMPRVLFTPFTYDNSKNFDELRLQAFSLSPSRFQTTCGRQCIKWHSPCLEESICGESWKINETHESSDSRRWDHVVLATNKTPWKEGFIAWVRMCKWGRACYDDCNQHYRAIKTDAKWERNGSHVHSLNVVSSKETEWNLRGLLVYGSLSLLFSSLEGHWAFFYDPTFHQ